ncbi:MAG: YbaN family protein [Alphaproteobacteria bacterium]|nr:YbaN family protein [Alphaproteobacteria bacterium]
MLALGFVATGVGIAGVILPGLPGTVFLIIGLWAFSRSSARFQMWLFNHPRFGAPLRAWHAHRVIPVRAKVAAVAMMVVSQAMVTVWVAGDAAMAADWTVPAVSAAVLALVASWIVTRPSRAPDPV